MLLQMKWVVFEETSMAYFSSREKSLCYTKALCYTKDGDNVKLLSE
jgi:hypothetical protein